MDSNFLIGEISQGYIIPYFYNQYGLPKPYLVSTSAELTEIKEHKEADILAYFMAGDELAKDVYDYWLKMAEFNLQYINQGKK